jgi:tetratricopeptide (TPR) repeat protein
MRFLVPAAGILLLSLTTPAPAFQGKAPAKAAAKGTDGAKAAAGKMDEAKVAALEAKLAKSPKDAKLKMEVAEAHYQVGHATMTNADLPPRQKYRPALKHFNRTLELNPKHAAAAAEKKLIEDVYKSMGMPVPK